MQRQQILHGHDMPLSNFGSPVPMQVQQHPNLQQQYFIQHENYNQVQQPTQDRLVYIPMQSQQPTQFYQSSQIQDNKHQNLFVGQPDSQPQKLIRIEQTRMPSHQHTNGQLDFNKGQTLQNIQFRQAFLYEKLRQKQAQQAQQKQRMSNCESNHLNQIQSNLTFKHQTTHQPVQIQTNFQNLPSQTPLFNGHQQQQAKRVTIKVQPVKELTFADLVSQNLKKNDVYISQPQKNLTLNQNLSQQPTFNNCSNFTNHQNDRQVKTMINTRFKTVYLETVQQSHPESSTFVTGNPSQQRPLLSNITNNFVQLGQNVNQIQNQKTTVDEPEKQIVEKFKFCNQNTEMQTLEQFLGVVKHIHQENNVAINQDKNQSRSVAPCQDDEEATFSALTPKPVMTFGISGMPTLQFYNGMDVLPQIFYQSCAVSESYIVAIQSPADFYKQASLKRMLRYKHVSGGNSGKPAQQSGPVKYKYDDSYVILKEISLEKQHVPDSHDFVVYLFKKDDNSLILRYYQCRCDRSKDSEMTKHGDTQESSPLLRGGQLVDGAQTMTDQNSGPNNYEAIENLIKEGKVANISQHLFSKSHDHCGKVFNTLTRFYAHLRLHCNEKKPYACPDQGCGLQSNQKCNIHQHFDRVHKGNNGESMEDCEMVKADD